MSREVIVRLRDDIDDSVRSDIEVRPFSFGGKHYEIDLHADSFAEFERDMTRWIKAGREVKNRKRKSAKVNGNEPKRKSSAEIHQWAADHGYDWDDKAQRQAVREWAIHNGKTAARSGTLPRRILEAHYAARESGEVLWPFSATGFTSE